MRKVFVMGVLLISIFMSSVSCGKNTEQLQTSDLPDDYFSQFYQTESVLLNIDNARSCGFLEDEIFVEEYFESEDYYKSLEQYYLNRADDGTSNNSSDAKMDSFTFPESKLTFSSLTGSIMSTYDLNKEIGGTILPRCYCKGQDKSVWISSILLHIESDEITYSIDRMQSYNGKVSHIELLPLKGIYQITQLLVTEKSIILLCIDDSFQTQMIFFDSNGKQDSSIQLDYIVSGNIVQDGDHICFSAFDNAGELKLCRVDMSNKELSEFALLSQDCSVFTPVGDTYYEVTSKGLFRLDIDSQPVITWNEVGILGRSVDIRFSDSKCIYTLNYLTSLGKLVVYTLSPSDVDVMGNRTEFVIAGYDLKGTCIPTLIEVLSVKHPEIQFVIRDYMDEVTCRIEDDNWAQIQREMYEIISLDIASSRSPDMYYDQYNDTGLGELARLGYLMDLTEFVNSLDIDYFFVDKMKIGEERPFCLCLDYGITGFEASPNYIQNPLTWSYQDFYESASHFSDYSFVQSIYSKKYLLKNMILANSELFISNEGANFNSSEYIQLLNWTKDVGRNATWDEYQDAYLDDGIYMLDWFGLNSLSSLIFLGEHVVVGYPNENGALHVIPYDILAISSQTENKELAEELIKLALSDEFQMNNYFSGENPVNVNAWETRFDEDYKYWEENDPSWLHYSRDEYYESFLEYIERADKYVYGSQAIIEICLDEAAAYYAGDYSAEKVAELTQERVSLYLEETRTAS